MSCRLQHVGRYVKHACIGLDKNKFNFNFVHGANISQAVAVAGKFDRVAWLKGSLVLFGQLSAGKLYSINNAVEFHVGEIAKHDCRVNLLDCAKLFHLEFLFTVYVYIIAKGQLLVNQKKSPANLQGFVVLEYYFLETMRMCAKSTQINLKIANLIRLQE